MSGGPDSICLLDCLLELKKENIFNIELIVCHVNHMLRKNANIDEEYVKNYCEKNNLKLFIKKADIKKLSEDEKKGLEETGRNVRYSFFNEVLKENKANKIAIAHNMNDNAETVIMKAIRGSRKYWP